MSEILTLEGFSLATECDYKDCEYQASWKVVSRCCGKVWFFCVLHYELNLDRAANYGVVCTKCSTIHQGNPFVNEESVR